jgi:putative nucleotidyltransferase with HDIG domain
LNAFVEIFTSLPVNEYKNVVMHSLQVAKFSRHLARSIGLKHHPEQVYLAGLLHDTGLILKASIENYDVFIDAFRNIPDLEKIVLTLDRKDRHSFISHLLASHIGFIDADCAKALTYHHTPFHQIDDDENVALLANCIKAADTISLAFMRNAEIFSEETLKTMIQSVEKDIGLSDEVKKAAIGTLKDVRNLVEFESAAKLIASLLDLRSPYTRIHTFSVSRITRQLTAELMTEIDARFMNIAAFLHDIGKMTTPLEILHKKGSLNEIETIVMRTHVVVTKKVLSKCKLEIFGSVSGSHHERLDGSGYPAGLKKDQINCT